MNWQSYIRGLIICTLIFGVLLLILTIFVSPEKGIFTVIIYMVSFFLFVLGLFSMVNFTARRLWTHNELIFDNIKNSMRQSVLVSAFAVSLLVLSSMRLLTWWDGIIMAISFVLIELYFKTRSYSV